MASCVADLLELFDHAWARLHGRMAGLGDAEWLWTPASDPRIGLRWRLAHIAQTLREERNARWLGLSSRPADTGPVDTAKAALEGVEAAYRHWRVNLEALTDDDLSQPIGDAAGPYGAATRRSFALHIADELIHHAAEAALLRDLYADRPS